MAHTNYAFAHAILPSLYHLIDPTIEVETHKTNPAHWGWNRVGEIAEILGVPSASVWNAYTYNAHRFDMGQGRGQGYHCNQRFICASATSGDSSVVRYAVDSVSGASVKFDGMPDDLMLPSGWVQGWLGKNVSMVLCLGEKPVPAVLLARPLNPVPRTMRVIDKCHILTDLLEQALLSAPVDVLDPLDETMLSLVSTFSEHMQFSLFARPWKRSRQRGSWNLVVQAYPMAASDTADGDTFDGWRFVLNQLLSV